jgi:proteasome lid subunit RPN8/RPN11
LAVSQSLGENMLLEYLDSKTFKTERSKAHKRANENGFEICGALIRQKNRSIKLYPLKNLATKPAKWEIELQWLKEIRKELKGSDQRLVGTFHSHVRGYAYPSPKDLEYYPSGFLMMIYDTRDKRVGMWKPLIRKKKGKLRAVAVCCKSPRWDEAEAIQYAQYLLGKFRKSKKRN